MYGISTRQTVPDMYIGAGIIIAKRDDAVWRFLLLKGRTTGVWSFSKGHPEQADKLSPLRTAARETFEETGLTVGEDYQIYGNSVRFGKRPYWLGVLRPDSSAILLSSREHSTYAWLTEEEIVHINGNTDVRAWVRKSRTGEFGRLLSISTLYRTSDMHSSASDHIAS